MKVGEYKGEKQVAENEGDGSQQRGKLGLGVGDLTPDMRQQLNIPSQVKGAAVQSVRPASPADDAGLAPGDVIQEVNRKPVQNAQEFAERCACRSGRQGHPAAGVVARRRKLPRGAPAAGRTERRVRNVLKQARLRPPHLLEVRRPFLFLDDLRRDSGNEKSAVTYQ